ncbi:MAG: ABC transporter substrate-binding protein [Chloroflexi bacterium]|nr:MAG: ABC transporter substrate-binding protein [Phototrophicales bacterium]RMF81481.1 MAG: ABC transporter substrate-binding protein [Chloroflexota bacterium]
MKKVFRIVVALLIIASMIPATLVVAQDERPPLGFWEECATPDALPETVDVGAIFTLTGAIATIGLSQQQGLELAAQHINESGYLGEGVTLNLIIEDSGDDAEGAISAMTKLVEDDEVVAVIGPTRSPQAFAADPIAAEAGIPVMGVSNTANGITTMNDDPELDQFIFRDSLPEAAVIPGAIRQAVEILGIEDAVIIFANDDEFAASGAEIFEQSLIDNGVEVLDVETYTTGDVDFNAQITNLLAGDPDLFVVSGLPSEGGLIINQARQQGYEGPFHGGNGFNTPQIIEQGGEAAEGALVGAAWHISNESEINNFFIDSYTEAFEISPDQFSAQAYTGGWLMATAIRCANSTDGQAIRDALAAIENFDSPLGLFSFDEDRNPVHDPVVQVIRDGTFQVLSGE